MVLATMLMVCGMKGFRTATCTRSAGHLAGVEVGPCATTARELYLPQDRLGQNSRKSGRKTPTKIGQVFTEPKDTLPRNIELER